MVKCIFCDLVMPYKNRGIGLKTVNDIKQHYVKKHNIDPNRQVFNNYLQYLLEDNVSYFIP